MTIHCRCEYCKNSQELCDVNFSQALKETIGRCGNCYGWSIISREMYDKFLQEKGIDRVNGNKEKHDE